MELVHLSLVAICCVTIHPTIPHRVYEGTEFQNLQTMVSKRRDVKQSIIYYPRGEPDEVKEQCWTDYKDALQGRDTAP